MARQEWRPLKGHTGIRYREYAGGERYYKFRQKNYKDDVLGIMPESQAIRLAAEIRDNRHTGIGPQSSDEMKEQQIIQAKDMALAAQAEAISRRLENEKLIAAEQFAQANTAASFWDNVYWPGRSKKGSAHNNDGILGVFNRWIRPTIGKISLQNLKFTDVSAVVHDTDGHAYIPAQPTNTAFDSGIFTLQ